MATSNANHALSSHLASKAGIQKRVLALQEELVWTIFLRVWSVLISAIRWVRLLLLPVSSLALEGAIKAEYRRYNISGIVGGDDYAAMRQALERRYKKAIAEDSKLPDILFIDGGKGQVSQAVDVLSELQISGVDIIGVTKGEGSRQDMDTLTVFSQSNSVSSVKKSLCYLRIPVHCT